MYSKSFICTVYNERMCFIFVKVNCKRENFALCCKISTQKTSVRRESKASCNCEFENRSTGRACTLAASSVLAEDVRSAFLSTMTSSPISGACSGAMRRSRLVTQALEDPLRGRQHLIGAGKRKDKLRSSSHGLYFSSYYY